jgi:hypothetical protein
MTSGRRDNNIKNGTFNAPNSCGREAPTNQSWGTLHGNGYRQDKDGVGTHTPPS